MTTYQYQPYEPGYFIGSEGENGEHLRSPNDGWPYSIYRMGRENGVSDSVLCHGIQHLDDAKQLLALVNGDIRPPIMSSTQMFAWN